MNALSEAPMFIDDAQQGIDEEKAPSVADAFQRGLERTPGRRWIDGTGLTHGLNGRRTECLHRVHHSSMLQVATDNSPTSATDPVARSP